MGAPWTTPTGGVAVAHAIVRRGSSKRKWRGLSKRVRIVGADDTPARAPVINDRLSTRVLGAMLLILTFIIDVSCFVFTKPEVRNARFPLIVLLPSLPLLALGVWLLRRGARMPEDEDD